MSNRFRYIVRPRENPNRKEAKQTKRYRTQIIPMSFSERTFNDGSPINYITMFFRRVVIRFRTGPRYPENDKLIDGGTSRVKQLSNRTRKLPL